MDDDNCKTTREERLAAKLRENLRRRKAQGKSIAAQCGEPPRDAAPLPKPDSQS